MAGTFVLLRSVARYPNATSFDLEIFQSAQRSNLAKGITGRLHKESGCFFHYLEGENEALQNLLDRMRQDDRHFAIQELQRGEFEFPLFANWDMGFCKGNHACIRQLLAHFLSKMLPRRLPMKSSASWRIKHHSCR